MVNHEKSKEIIFIILISIETFRDDTHSTLKKSELRPDDPGLPDPPRLRPL